MPRLTPKALEYVFQFIERKKGQTSNKSLKQALETVYQLMRESDDGRHPEKIAAALYYLEHLPVKESGMFFESTLPLGASLIARHQSCLGKVILQGEDLDTVANGIPKAPLQPAARQAMGNIHVSLMKFYQQSWTYSYPLDNTGQVMNDAIAIWQNPLIGVGKADNPRKAYVDFKRDYQILGESLKNARDDDVTSAIKRLVNKSNADERQKGLLTSWLQAKGGQGVNRFVDFLLLNGELGPKEAGLLQAKGLENIWFAENGNIYFSYDMAVSSLMLPDGKMLYANSRAEALMTDDPQEMADAVKVKKGKSPPVLMRVNARIRLDIDNDQVVPKIVNLDITSYTDKLLSPKRLEAERKIAAKKTLVNANDKKPKV